MCVVIRGVCRLILTGLTVTLAAYLRYGGRNIAMQRANAERSERFRRLLSRGKFLVLTDK